MFQLEQKGNILEGKISELENKNLYLEDNSRTGNIKLENSKRIPIWTRIKKTPNGCFATFSNQSTSTKMAIVSRYSASIVLIRRKTQNRDESLQSLFHTKIASKSFRWTTGCKALVTKCTKTSPTVLLKEEENKWTPSKLSAKRNKLVATFSKS